MDPDFVGLRNFARFFGIDLDYEDYNLAPEDPQPLEEQVPLLPGQIRIAQHADELFGEIFGDMEGDVVVWEEDEGHWDIEDEDADLEEEFVPEDPVQEQYYETDEGNVQGH